MTLAHHDLGMTDSPIDAWLVPPHNSQRQKRAADRRSRAMRLSALFEEFSQYLKVERGASHRSIDTYRRYFTYFVNFTKEQIRGPLLIADFTPELCRSYQYFMASKELQPGSIRVRLAVLGSFGKWAVKHSRLEKNPMEVITLPAKKSRVPAVPKWEAVEEFLTRCPRLRDKAVLALMVYGGLRRVLGKGGNESTVPLPEVARAIVSQYLATERPGAAASEPLFLVRYWWYGGEKKSRRIFWSTDLEDHQGPRQARGCGHHP